MRCYGLRAALLSGASLWLGLVGAAAVSALLVALGWIIYFHSERTVLAALRARPVSEVERPDLYRIVRELAFSAHLPVPRLFVSPSVEQSRCLPLAGGGVTCGNLRARWAVEPVVLPAARPTVEVRAG